MNMLDFKIINFYNIILYNILEWMKYYSHKKINYVNKEITYNNHGFMVLGFTVTTSNEANEIHHLTLGINKLFLQKAEEDLKYLIENFLLEDIKKYLKLLE